MNTWRPGPDSEPFQLVELWVTGGAESWKHIQDCGVAEAP